METILLVILIIIALALIGVVLVQRSEGGALGIGGGGPGGMFSSRGSANLLTRVTAGLAAAFMILSLILVILEGGNRRSQSVMDTAEIKGEAQSESEVQTPLKTDSSTNPATDATGEAPAPSAPESGAATPSDGKPVVPQSE
ncbi:MAG: preprotein translocase subunit SecG [Alphaproteobacteria bacterium]|nr:preprotein translocase subunit SecG [Alphaproteobacteria bacterium]